ncbi:hypothetical protein PMKS-000201 [Pichia membranifaciens]|uniref:Uncharacterized protein n=1 Tax=Pichia membranifaciens TaxID=4926 RepID=A0A1Q2YB22_9ASCO|nr:hypothetical protein PMKS-000201 [Pichia membranifaciens]
MYSSSSGGNDGTDSDMISSRLDIDFIKSLPPKPALSRKVCLEDSKSLQNFLKLSRAATDDNLRSDLNSILNRNEVNKTSIFKFSRSDKEDESACIPFLQLVIYPEWKKRVDVIKYCQGEIDDILSGNAVMDDGGFSKLTPEEKNNILRIDPYTYKDLEQKYLRANAKNMELKNFYDNEDKVETIVSRRSIQLMNDICQLGSFDVAGNFLKYASSSTNGKQ